MMTGAGSAARRRATSSGTEGNTDTYVFPISDVGAYVAEILSGVRAVTAVGEDQQMRFLDYLLAIAESQANYVASRQRQWPEERRSRRRTLKSKRRVVAASAEAPSSKASSTKGSNPGSSAE